MDSSTNCCAFVLRSRMLLTAPDSFWSYELMKRWTTVENESSHQTAVKVLVCGGIAGIVTWASVFPLDVVKTRVQTQESFSLPSAARSSESQALLSPSIQKEHPLGAIEITKRAYRENGFRVFYRGLGVCSVRAFVVNAVQVRQYSFLP